ncbi:MAG TPA: hypothetical protein VFD36_24010 [Kofleriaceae bacterium]|nr:hypothetical protein [Kofleriaceae bacterium]
MIRSSKRRELPGGAQTVQLAPVELEAIVQAADLAAGSRPVKLGGPGTPTVALTAVEIDALVLGAEDAHAAADPDSRPTVEHVRIARGTESQPATTVHARGPRRARETLRADSIRRPGPTAPTRKR